jgi:hypothetical protein
VHFLIKISAFPVVPAERYAPEMPFPSGKAVTQWWIKKDVSAAVFV